MILVEHEDFEQTSSAPAEPQGLYNETALACRIPRLRMVDLRMARSSCTGGVRLNGFESQEGVQGRWWLVSDLRAALVSSHLEPITAQPSGGHRGL
jgi:hypothetical protein